MGIKLWLRLLETCYILGQTYYSYDLQTTQWVFVLNGIREY